MSGRLQNPGAIHDAVRNATFFISVAWTLFASGVLIVRCLGR